MCTRLLSQFLRLWVYDYDSVPVSRVPIPPDLRFCFGPPECCSVFPIRVLRGHLAPCTSRSILLSLNNELSTIYPLHPIYGITVIALKPCFL
ncbi:uncharacterized protein TNCT_565721 [Trichonephila clavata]|uniref:Uncharacterized protein n=1 Tax=Trichonephila clavata TaxID=2740835 RepID=A0A8X6KF25_TRICU|nr:uncharacterized protein TNCT_565721 [Trichonephila clavata]